MSYEDRKEKIIEYLKNNRFVTFKDLSNMLNVSEMTIRRDILKLEKERLINRKYKGIELNREYNSTITSTLDYSVNNKHYNDVGNNSDIIINEVAKKLMLYKNIFIDSGDLNLELSKHIALNWNNYRSLDFITSNIEIARILGNTSLNVYMICGKVIKNNISIADSLCNQLSNNIIIDLLILEPIAVDIEFGLSEYNICDATNKKLLINRSNNILLLFKPNNFDKKALYKITNIDNRFFCIVLREEIKILSKYEKTMNIEYI
jgi:DeoR/GlpR family transcriptional regulator of sugar metabolism